MSAVLKQAVPVSKVAGARGYSGQLKAGQKVTLDKVQAHGSHLYVQTPSGWILLPDKALYR